MRVLAINCGSSSLKFEVVETAAEGRPARGAVERIGADAELSATGPDGQDIRRAVPAADHGRAAHLVLDWLRQAGQLSAGGIAAVGHRVVHGGDRFVAPVLIDAAVLAAIQALEELAPLHNGPALAAITAARTALDPSVPMVATFDTAFHADMPPRAARYALPRDLAARHHVRRYGFHGLAHRSMVERYAAVTGTPMEQARLVTLQLGSGCSAAAIAGGRSVDTSMGFTPLEGLVMGTRSGDLDPSLAGFLAEREGVAVSEVERWLNTRAGLLGVSGRSADMKQLLELERAGDADAALAVEMFCYRARKYIGAYLAALEGADAIVFGGGIGERAPAVRARILAGLGWCGLVLDHARNAAAVGVAARITADAARIHAYVLPVDEALLIARDTAAVVRAVRGDGAP
jgi:acetate kinase